MREDQGLASVPLVGYFIRCRVVAVFYGLIRGWETSSPVARDALRDIAAFGESRMLIYIQDFEGP